MLLHDLTVLAAMDSAVPDVFSQTRRESRMMVDLAVRVTRLRTEQELFGISADISSSGIAVYLPHDLRLGERVRLCLCFSNYRDVLTVEAVVRNRRSYRYGLEFDADDVRNKQLHALFQLITVL